MKYTSTDSINDFEFHDAEFSLIQWNGNDLIVSAKYLNIHKDTPQNSTDTDMEISEARITFSECRIKEFEPSRTWKTDINGEYYTDDPLVIHTGATARDMFENELRNTITVLGVAFDNGSYELSAVGIGPYFSVRFAFSGFRAEWNDYCGKAWYEARKHYEKQLTVLTDSGNIKLEAHIICHDDNFFSSYGDKEEAHSVSLGIKYEGKEIWGNGKSYTWEDAFADLQKKTSLWCKINVLYDLPSREYVSFRKQARRIVLHQRYRNQAKK